MSYFVRTEPTETERAQIIVRSVVRKRRRQLIQMNDDTDNNKEQTQSEQSLLDDTVSDGLNMQFHIDQEQLKPTQAGPQDDEIDESAKNAPEAQIMIPQQDEVPKLGGKGMSEEIKNLLRHPDEPEVKNSVEQDAHNEVTDATMTALDQDIDMSGLELEKIITYSFEDGKLHFLVEFKSGRTCLYHMPHFVKIFH